MSRDQAERALRRLAGRRETSALAAMADDRIIAEYLVETPKSLAAAAESMAGEQSTGTFTRVPGETDELRERFAARVESIEELEPVAAPSLPGAAVPPGPSGVSARPRADQLSAGEHGAESAGDHLDGRRQSVRTALPLRPAAAGPRISRSRSPPTFPARSLASPARGDSPASTIARSSARSSSRASASRPPQRPTWSARSARPASISSKTTS